MSGNNSLAVLESHIEKHIQLLKELKTELDTALEKDVVLIGKTKRSAAMVASIIESYYTCGETIFFRISQFFENSLTDYRWHKDLLEKMVSHIKDLRPRVISDEVYNDLLELLRFRHFKCYYFQLSYDWERLDEIIKRTNRLHPALLQNLGEYLAYVESLRE